MKNPKKTKSKLKRFFLDVISFGSPQAIVFNLSSIFFFLIVTPTSKLGYSPFKCVFKNLILPLIFGGQCPTEGFFMDCNCPACGMTRALSRLLHGDPTGAWNFNKMVFVVFAVMIILLITNIIRTVKFYKKTGKIY